jgi:hypothetical protein
MPAAMALPDTVPCACPWLDAFREKLTTSVIGIESQE